MRQVIGDISYITSWEKKCNLNYEYVNMHREKSWKETDQNITRGFPFFHSPIHQVSGIELGPDLWDHG